jgi:hypothetical protein
MTGRDQAAQCDTEPKAIGCTNCRRPSPVLQPLPGELGQVWDRPVPVWKMPLSISGVQMLVLPNALSPYLPARVRRIAAPCPPPRSAVFAASTLSQALKV